MITLPDNWCNYGAIISSFRISTASRSPARTPRARARMRSTLWCSSRARAGSPTSSTWARPSPSRPTRMHLLAPYTVSEWSDIAAAQRASDKTWWADYGGYVAIGYNSAVVKTPPTSFKDLLKPIYNHDGRHQQQPDGGRRRLCRRVRRRPVQRGLVQQHPSRASTTSPSSTRRATSCPSSPARPRCRAVRPPS